MITMYLPTVERPLWPCVLLLLIFIPISVWHEIHWHRTIAEYAALRRAAGAGDDEWPNSELRWVLSLQPWLLLVVASMLAMMVGLGAAALLAWPHRLPFFSEVLNYYDRPYLTAVLIAGAAAVVGTVTLSIDLIGSSWREVANHIRRAVHAPKATRDRHFALALAADPEVPHAT